MDGQLRCSVCEAMTPVSEIKYHTQDRLHIFCGAQCSLSYHQRKDNEKTNNNIEDFNNNNSNQSSDTASATVNRNLGERNAS
jgi:hypothetical protein